jgi:hypothetical protein
MHAELEVERGSDLDWDAVARWTGEARSTAFGRFNREKQSQVEGFLRLLERMPTDARSRVLRSLRAYPSFKDPRIAHDQTQLSRLKLLLEKPTGTTLVYDSNEEDRTFLVTAMARGAGDMIQGFDSHPERWFVGAPTISYLGTMLPPQRLQAWVKLDLAAPINLFSGVFLQLPVEFQRKITGLARRRHVLLADAFGGVKAGEWIAPLHTVRVLNNGNGRIYAQVESW